MALLLAACADDGPEDDLGNGRSTEEPATAPDDGDGGPDDRDGLPDRNDGSTDEPADDPAPDPDDEAGTEPEGAEPLPGQPTDQRTERDGAWGEDLRVVEVRAGAHDGFDRVTFELTGQGEPGWHIEPQDDPVAQGSGRPLDVAGTTSLIVAIQPLPYPEDGELTAPERVAAPEDAAVLSEVVQDSLFEGFHRFAFGLEGPASYVVAHLEDPDRVVIDLYPTN